ncbi:MAG: TIGR04282 family arsenosugar biosynthesis glycosyltransferase [Pseudolabrys sp.]|nr:TIGR04282 family arsenosugar biosynthesis glycosyltransferase [Pseudolabrys sp.]
MKPVVIALVCKTPAAGHSKTRLSPPLRPEECAALSACFIRDVAAKVQSLVAGGAVDACAVYTPVGSEAALRELLPPGFALRAQSKGDLGVRMATAVADLLAAGHEGVIVIGSDSPTMPVAILREAIDAVHAGDNVVLGPVLDGGYALIGLSRPHPRLFEDMPWSTPDVHALTVERAREIGLPVVNLPRWYDVDDAASFAMLEDEMRGIVPDFAEAGLKGSAAPATFEFLRGRRRL